MWLNTLILFIGFLTLWLICEAPMWLNTLILFIGFLTLWLMWRKKKLSLFEELNISGPKPSLLFGNFWELLHEGQENCIKKWIKEYGKVFGYYYGLRPVIIIADPDLLKIVQQKEFQKFSHRPALFELGSSSKDFNRHSITTVNGQKWKDIRSILTPTFTTSKLKMMNPIVNGAVDELVDAVEKKAVSGKSFDIYTLYQNLTMDVIARTSLGVHSRAQTDKNESLVKLARLIMSFKLGYFLMLAFSFPEFMSIFSTIRRIVLGFYNSGKHPRREMMERTIAAIKTRRTDPNSRRRDVLQFMMDAQKSEEPVSDSSLTAGVTDDYVSNDTAKESPKTIMRLTDDEILHNATVLLLAGYETTSTALIFATYALTYHQDIQDKVREELMNSIKDEKEISYETVHKLPYLDQFINETLRVYPPIVYFVNRLAVEDTVLENVRIPKGVAIQVPVYNLQHDSAYWDNPEEFRPERFSPEEKSNRHPMVFQPFGAGPRNCVGMRFALTEMKMALTKLLYKYKFMPVPGTKKEDLELSFTAVIMRPKNGLHIIAEKI